MIEGLHTEYWDVGLSVRGVHRPPCKICHRSLLPTIVTQRRTPAGVEYGAICRECAEVIAACLYQQESVEIALVRETPTEQPAPSGGTEQPAQS